MSGFQGSTSIVPLKLWWCNEPHLLGSELVWILAGIEGAELLMLMSSTWAGCALAIAALYFSSRLHPLLTYTPQIGIQR